MERFVKIAEGLDVAPALAELAARSDHWLQVGTDAQDFIHLLGPDMARVFEDELSHVWALIDAAYAAAAERIGDRGAICYARVGRMPPGTGLPPHFDGIDGVRQRRYHVSLQSAPGAELVIEEEARCWLAGEAWHIDASRLHSIVNNSTVDRITIVFDTLA